MKSLLRLAIYCTFPYSSPESYLLLLTSGLAVCAATVTVLIYNMVAFSFLSRQIASLVPIVSHMKSSNGVTHKKHVLLALVQSIPAWQLYVQRKQVEY